MKFDGFDWFMLILAILCTIVIVILITGCNNQSQKPYSDPNVDVYTLTGEQIDTIFDYKNSEAELAAKEKALADLRAFRIQMLWAVLGAGVLAIFWKPTIGIPLAVLCAFMMGFAQALMTYSVYIGWVSMGLSVLMVGYVIWLKHDELFAMTKKASVATVALKEVVTGVENAKSGATVTIQTGDNQGMIKSVKDIIGDAQIEAQKTPATTELVSAIRKDLLPNK